MAAPNDVPKHHIRGEVCSTRPTYRDGRHQKAVKVYTVNLESKYLLVQGVQAVGATQELVKLFALYGAVAEYRTLDEYPTADQFTDVFLIKYEKIQAARIARRKLDDWSFYSGILHVCYAPEHESVEETRLKLQDRRKSVAARIRKNEAENGKSGVGNNLAGQSQSAVSGQSSSRQGQRSNSQWSTAKGQLHMKSFQDSKSSQMSRVDKPNNTNPRETQRTADRMPRSNTRVPPLPHTASAVPPLPHTTGAAPLEEEKQIWIPPPPKEVANRKAISHHSVTGYEFARVRTAHSVYPPNYDARLSTISDNTQTYNQYVCTQPKREDMSKSNPQTNSDFKEMFLTRNLSKGDNPDKDMKQEDCKNSDSGQTAKTNSKVKFQAGVVVRAFTPQTAPPKFVPRQMMKSSKKTVNRSVKTSKDEVNKELRQKALQLGEIQGPVAQGEESVQEPRKPTETEESVEKTRIQIRKRVSEITTEEKSIVKKAKSS